MNKLLRVSSIQRFSIHDGPGIRSTVFLKGCALNCIWCHNVESIRPDPQLMFYSERCLLNQNPPKNCSRACIGSCTTQAVKYQKEKHKIEVNFRECNACGECEMHCPREVFGILGRSQSVEEVYGELKADQLFYEGSNGGVTISGGEPLLQTEAVLQLLSLCKKGNVHTLLETSAAAHWERLHPLIPFVDMFYIDIKTSPATHRQLTGADQTQIIDNIHRLLNLGLGHRIHLRMPIVPGINDSESIITDIAHLLHELKKPQLTLLTYNHLWEAKLPRLSTAQKPLNIKLDKREGVERAQRLFMQLGIEATAAVCSTYLTGSPQTEQSNNKSENSKFSARIHKLKKAIEEGEKECCIERAQNAHNYYSSRQNMGKTPQIQRAELLKEILRKKTLIIWDNELLVGNYTSKRVGAQIMPEFATGNSVIVLDTYKLDTRKHNPFKITLAQKVQLWKMIPFWINKNFVRKVYEDSFFGYLKFLLQIFRLKEIIYTEISGMGHMTPNFQYLLENGTINIKKDVNERKMGTDDPKKSDFYESVGIVLEGLEEFGDRYLELAKEMLVKEKVAKDGKEERVKDLENIIKVCSRIPRHPVQTLQEALQFMLFIQITLNLDNMDNSITPL